MGEWGGLASIFTGEWGGNGGGGGGVCARTVGRGRESGKGPESARTWEARGGHGGLNGEAEGWGVS